MLRIGVDIGGTNIKLGLVNDSLQIIARDAFPFPHTDSETVAKQIADASRRLLLNQGLTLDAVSSVGVVVPGSIDPTGTIVLHAYNLDFHHVPFQAQLQAQFGAHPVFLANDADGAALAELGIGAFQGCRSAVLMTLGTGVGGGVILNGRLYTGGNGHGVELGHMPLVAGGEPCTCGLYGCIEAYCSATALAREGLRAASAHPESVLAAHGTDLDAKTVIDSAKAGDPAAQDVFARYVDYLGSACIAIVHLLDPEVIAIGGGICGAGEFLFQPLRKNVAEKCFFSDFASIVPATAGNDAGIIGAAMLGHHNESLFC